MSSYYVWEFKKAFFSFVEDTIPVLIQRELEPPLLPQVQHLRHIASKILLPAKLEQPYIFFVANVVISM